MRTTAESQVVVNQKKINRQLEQALKALDSGDIAAAVEYLKETVQGLPDGVTKTHLSVAINALQYSNDTKGPMMHVQLVQDSLQNSTG